MPVTRCLALYTCLLFTGTDTRNVPACRPAGPATSSILLGQSALPVSLGLAELWRWWDAFVKPCLCRPGPQGRQPSPQQLLELRSLLLRSEDLRQPMNLREQLQSANGMSEDANRSLVTLLQVARQLETVAPWADARP